MPSTFHGIEVGKRSLIGHTLGLNTIGHNLSNASTEGYSRQRVEMKAFEPIFMPQYNREERPGQLGQGMDVSRIERVRDMLLEGRIVAEASGEGFWAARDQYILLLEQIHNEPTELSVRTLLDRFWSAWQELSVNPTEVGARQAVLERGKALIDGLHGRFHRLKETRDMLEQDVRGRGGPGQRAGPGDRGPERADREEQGPGGQPQRPAGPARPAGGQAVGADRHHHRLPGSRTSSWSTPAAGTWCRAATGSRWPPCPTRTTRATPG